jgi:hypothetical protein
MYATQLADKVKRLAGKTHKDRVHEFNSKLESLSEHHDIPKVSITSSPLSSYLLTHQSGWSWIMFRVENSGGLPCGYVTLFTVLCVPYRGFRITH